MANKLITILLCCMTSMVYADIPPNSKIDKLGSSEDPIISLKKISKAFENIAQTVHPAVVNIHTERTILNSTVGQEGDFSPLLEEFLRKFYGLPYSIPEGNKQRVAAHGTGFIMRHDGYIITNNHVIDKADRILVKLFDKREFEAKIIGQDEKTDIAVIKIMGTDFIPIKVGNSDTTAVGEWVLAIGNPFGFSHSMTFGIVSAKGRSELGVSMYENFIQTDAAINPGNSGGPLVNLAGEVIGMNTLIISVSRDMPLYSGIGFAIPMNLVNHVATKLITHGSMPWGYIGVQMQNLTQELANSFGLQNTKGALISQVLESSPAKASGLRQGDVIIAFNDASVSNVEELRRLVVMASPNSLHKVRVLRGGKVKDLPLTIGAYPGTEQPTKVSNTSHNAKQYVEKSLGIAAIDLNDAILRQLKMPSHQRGVVVADVKVGSIAMLAGLRKGLMILEVNQQPINSSQQFYELTAHSLRKSKRVLFLVQVEDSMQYLTLGL